MNLLQDKEGTSQEVGSDSGKNQQVVSATSGVSSLFSEIKFDLLKLCLHSAKAKVTPLENSFPKQVAS